MVSIILGCYKVIVFFFKCGKMLYLKKNIYPPFHPMLNYEMGNF